eukprot:37037-Ditylum_brightwellii.AAC.1
MRDATDSLEYYLANNIAKRNGKVVISTKKCFKETFEGSIRINMEHCQKNLQLKPKEQPELDGSEFANEEEHKEYQHIVGVGQ